jgi:titin
MPPAGVLATPNSAAQIGVTWAASQSGLPISHYNVYKGTSASSLTQVAQVTKTSYTDNSGAPVTTYYYAIQAVDSGTPQAESGLSTPVSATTYANPGAPTNLSATPTSDSKVAVAWSASVSGGLPIQYYHIYRGTSLSNLVQVAVGKQTSYNDTNVTIGATYYYEVQAGDTGGDLSPMSANVAATIPAAPGTPTNLVATPFSTVKIGLSWSASASGGLPVQYYHVYRGSKPSALTQLATTQQTWYNDATGSPSTTYYYAVQAIDSGGDLSPMSATVSAATLALPSAPANLTATAVSQGQIDLAWTPGTSGMPLGSYTIFRGTSPKSLTSLQVVSATKTSFIDLTVTSNTTYYYGVEATDAGGNVSPMSNVAQATTPSGK